MLNVACMCSCCLITMLCRISQGVLVLGIVSFLSCIFACCAGPIPLSADNGGNTAPHTFPVLLMPPVAVHRTSTFFAVSYLIFMGFLLIVEIGLPSFIFANSPHNIPHFPSSVAFPVTSTQLSPLFLSPSLLTISKRSKEFSLIRPKA